MGALGGDLATISVTNISRCMEHIVDLRINLQTYASLLLTVFHCFAFSLEAPRICPQTTAPIRPGFQSEPCSFFLWDDVPSVLL